MNFRSDTLVCRRIVTDSRTVQPGDLFWAIKGARHDGHHYLDEAVRRGAVACVVNLQQVLQPAVPMIAVADTQQALADLAGWHRRQQEALVIGITGSVGKTTTRHLVHTVLSQRFSGVQSPQNFNNHLGVPLSLLAIEPEHEFAVLELGASTAGEIRSLCEVAQPEVGLLTRIAPAHLDEFRDLDTIARTKGELLEILPSTGFAVLNGDDDRVRRLAARAACPKILVGEQPGNDIVARDVRLENTWLRFRVGSAHLSVPIPGRHHLISALMAVAVATEIGLTPGEIEEGLVRFQPVSGRCRPLQIGEWTVIDDTYNASPASMRAACELLCHWQGRGQKILIAGDMLALGKSSLQYHEQFGEQVVAAGIDRLLVVGRQAHTSAARALALGMDGGRIGTCRDLEALTLLLDLWLEPGDIVLIKGSRGMQMEQVITRMEQLARDRSQSEPVLRRAVA
jgi:UDP-N-acetylmuramoyl-tripeptide--D-alanyl-D-alanine ligase